MKSAAEHMQEVSNRWAQSLDSYLRNDDLRTKVATLVERFFAQHAGIERTPLAEAFITALSLEAVLNIHPETHPVAPNAEAA